MYRVTFPCIVLCVYAVLCCGLCDAQAVLRPRCPAQVGDRCQDSEDSASGEYNYKVDGRNVKIWYMAGSHFDMECDNETRSTEHPALPRFPELVHVHSVTLSACAPPALPYACVFAALNVSVTDLLKLNKLPAAPPLRDDHFEGLKSLERLDLRGSSPAALLPHKILAPLPALRELRLQHVRPGTVLEALPLTLNSLQLLFTDTKLVAPAGALGLMLNSLLVREEGAVIVNITGAPVLSSLYIASDSSSVVGVHSSLHRLGIDYWSETQPEPWVQCGALEHLNLIDKGSLPQTVLPDGWVARCPVLSELSILRVPLAPLPARLLENATALTTLKLVGCRLRELPKDLFNGLVKLTTLDLSYNQLEMLPGDLFFPLRTLETLNLSDNMLINNATTALAPLSRLKELLLANNMQLQDLCYGGTDKFKTISGPSPLQLMKGLTKLILRNTSVSRVCQDWRESMPHLMLLDLIETNITALQYDDMVQQRSEQGAKMQVSSRNNIVRLEYSINDYKRAERELVTLSDKFIDIKVVVVCDCHAYWAALAFRNGSRHARIIAPRCAGRRNSLRDVPLDELTCDAPELCTNLTGCSCVWRDDHDRRSRVATAWCENHGLTTVPGPLPVGTIWRLMLANNSIASVNASDLPPHLHELDLHNNTLKGFDKDVAVALRTRRVRLDNNPLRCDCDAIGLLELVTRPERIDLKNVTCGPESQLPSLEWITSNCTALRTLEPPSTLEPAAIIAALLMVLAIATLVLVMVLTRPETRLRIKILLWRFGLLAPDSKNEGVGDVDDGRLFDAFVSHAHEDEDWVRSTLVEKLESGPAPFRLCVHYRDWAPGEWIPAQIAASVRASRRTLAVVSRHFLKSDWARLEFREAHAQACRDVTPRLVVLLLEDPTLLPLDTEMRSFIENNTYVRWGDPWFWRKLEEAMPPRTKHSHVTQSPTAPAETSQVELPQVLRKFSTPAVPSEVINQSPTPAKAPHLYCSTEPRTTVPCPLSSTQYKMSLAR